MPQSDGFLRDWFPKRKPKVNPSAPNYAAKCTLQTTVLSDTSLENLVNKVNAYASDKMAASIDIRKNTDTSTSGQLCGALNHPKVTWFAQINYWVEI